MIPPSVIPCPLPSPVPPWLGAVLGGGMTSDADAAAYSAARGLTPAQAESLDRFMGVIKAAGVVPAQMTLGRSEWLARSGALWLPVVGNTTTITGSVTDAAEGQQFPGTAGSFARFANPLQNAALTGLGMFVVGRALTGASSQHMLSGYSGGSNQGPGLVLNASPRQGTISNALFFDISNAANQGPIAGYNTQRAAHTGAMMAFGGGWAGAGLQSPRMFAGAWSNIGAAIDIDVIWNNVATWAIGSRPDQTASIVGAIAFALVSSTTMTEDRYATIYNAGLKYGIFQTAATSVIVGMGDSLMAGGASGGSLPLQNTITHQLTMTATGGAWQNAATADNEGVGGSDITSAEGAQKTAAQRWARADGFANRWILHFGMHNDPGYQSSDEATRNALIERYVAVFSALKSLGAKIAVISPLEGTGGTPTQYAANTAYRARLATRCAEEGFVYVDLHTDPDFSVASRNASYFTDAIHLSAAGYTRATQLFVAAIPSPDS